MYASADVRRSVAECGARATARALLAALLAGCGGGNHGGASPEQRVEAAEREVLALAEASSCTASDQCTGTFVSDYRAACTFKFIPYSISTVDRGRLQLALREHNDRVRDYFAQREPVVCTALIPQPPGVACRQQRCVVTVQ